VILLYHVNVTIIRNIHNHHHHLSDNWTGANFYDWMDAFVVVPSVKNFQEDQLNSRRLPIFPGGIKNSRRFPVSPEFTGAVDILAAFW